MPHIVILAYNKTALTRRCLQSTLDAGYPMKQICLIDNGSLPGFQDEIKQHFPELTMIPIPQNAGFAGGFTRGLRQFWQTHPDVQSILFLTNDTAPQPGCLEACMKTAQETDAGIVAPCITFRTETTRIDSNAARFDRHTATLHHYKTTSLPTILQADDYIPGTALWLSKTAFEQLGGTDENYVMYWEDVDFSFRAHQTGVIQARCENALIRHGVGQTCHKKPIYSTYYYQRNRIRFCKKWLTPEEWENVLPTIRNELEYLKTKAINNNDTNRLHFITQIETELPLS